MSLPLCTSKGPVPGVVTNTSSRAVRLLGSNVGQRPQVSSRPINFFFKFLSLDFAEIFQFLFREFEAFVCCLLSSIVIVRMESTALTPRRVRSGSSLLLFSGEFCWVSTRLVPICPTNILFFSSLIYSSSIACVFWYFKRFVFMYRSGFLCPPSRVLFAMTVGQLIHRFIAI